MTPRDQPASDPAPAMKVAEDSRTIQRGSRLVPIVMLIAAVVSFVAFAIELPDQRLELFTVSSLDDIPSPGRDVFVFARVRGEGDILHFGAVNSDGVDETDHREDIGALATTAPAKTALAKLKATLARDWPTGATNPNLSVDQRKEIMDQTFDLLLACDIVTQREIWWSDFSTFVQGSAHAVATGFPAIMAGQLRTMLILALYALVPGLFGLIYRRAFGTWFVVSFVVLLIVNRGFAAMGFNMIAARPTAEPWTEPFVRRVEELVVLLLVVFRVRRHSVWTVDGAATPEHRSKNIVVCLDGTWNQPGEKDFDHVAVTNVFKVFSACKGQMSRQHSNASQTKVYPDDRSTQQIAFYYRGVGNRVDNSTLGQLFGGAFGLGAEAIVERSYLDVVKAYRPGDRIFIFGFSRGAAIARLLAGAIGRRGVPKSLWTLRGFGRLWLLWKSSRALDVQVDVLGCWDTVGSFGIAKNIFGIPFQSINLLKDLGVSLCVKRAYHMVALDETRDAFVPTLMDPDPTAPDRIIEVWFGGNHSNVGGGYATDNLSDVTLDFLLSHVTSGYSRDAGQTPGNEAWGLYLSAVRKGLSGYETAARYERIDPNPRGSIRHATGPMYSHAPRKLPVHAVIHDHVFERLDESLPVYAPQSLFDLNEDLVKKRTDIETEVKRLVDTGSLAPEEAERILAWSGKHLSLMKWSRYLDLRTNQTNRLADRLNPAAELRNTLG